MFYTGLELAQKRPRDPLDPICWHVLRVAATFGTVFVRRCPHHPCSKFFIPPTNRKLFCSDSCRALHHAFELSGLRTPEELIEAREKKNKYMREQKKHPVVIRRQK
jgi:hypothetical protein